MTHQRNSKGHAFSPDDRTQSVDFEFRSRLHQRCVCGEMLCEFRIVIQPPESIGGENNVCGAAPVQFFKISSRFLAIARNTSVNAVFFKEMPALALRVTKYRWVASVYGDD